MYIVQNLFLLHNLLRNTRISHKTDRIDNDKDKMQIFMIENCLHIESNFYLFCVCVCVWRNDAL